MFPAATTTTTPERTSWSTTMHSGLRPQANHSASNPYPRLRFTPWIRGTLLLTRCARDVLQRQDHPADAGCLSPPPPRTLRLTSLARGAIPRAGLRRGFGGVGRFAVSPGDPTLYRCAVRSPFRLCRRSSFFQPAGDDSGDMGPVAVSSTRASAGRVVRRSVNVAMQGSFTDLGSVSV